jgi:Coenzyme PQQ synthesis protein D (PqqD)
MPALQFTFVRHNSCRSIRMRKGSVQPNNCYVRDEHVVTRVIEGETIVVPMKQTVEDLKAIFTLNEMAGVIWERVDGRATVADLIGSIYREYRVPAEKVIQDVVDLLATFEADGLIHRSRPHECAREEN